MRTLQDAWNTVHAAREAIRQGYLKPDAATQDLLALAAEIERQMPDVMLGRFAKANMVELRGGWQINQAFIPGAPSLEELHDALPRVA